jgi:large subunit ribosomal protein L21
MFAVVEIAGKQYIIEKGTIVDVDRLDEKESASINIDKILLVSDGKKATIGQPYVDGASAKAKVLEQVKDKKIIAMRYKRKTGVDTVRGHRQQLTRLLIEEVKGA